jgi:Ca2+-binding RTX toxin-like protein
MTTTLVSSNLTTLQLLDGDDVLILPEEYSITTTGFSNTVRLAGNADSVFIDGDLIATGFAAMLVSSTADNAGVYIGETGRVFSSSDYYTSFSMLGDFGSLINHGQILGNVHGFYMAGTFNNAVNHGDITSLTGTAVEISGRAPVFTNYGVITGEDIGIELSSNFVSDVSTLKNFGTITAETGLLINGYGSALNVENHGTVTGSVHAVHMANNNINLLNTGDLAGLTLIEGQAGTLINSGTMRDISVAAAALQTQITNQSSGVIQGPVSSAATDGVRFTNAGTVQGNVGFAGGEEAVANSGLIQGSLHLGDGDDSFDGRDGTVTAGVYGGAGDDIYIVNGSNVTLVEYADEGTDTVFAETDFTLAAQIENLALTGAADFHGIGNALANKIFGNDGDNMLSGRDGWDQITGGDGNDFLRGGAGKDSLFGEAGDDTIRAGSGGDTASGGEGDDLLDGRAGKDRLLGEDGHDTLLGGADNDTLNGGEGDDVLRGGLGNDQMTGGAGADRFVFAATSDSDDLEYDRISDFTRGEDLIDLRDLIEGQLTLNLLGSFAGGGVASIRTVETGGDTRINIDVDGDGTRDMRIDVTGVTGLDGTDFLL